MQLQFITIKTAPTTIGRVLLAIAEIPTVAVGRATGIKVAAFFIKTSAPVSGKPAGSFLERTIAAAWTGRSFVTLSLLYGDNGAHEKSSIQVIYSIISTEFFCHLHKAKAFRHSCLWVYDDLYRCNFSEFRKDISEILFGCFRAEIADKKIHKILLRGLWSDHQKARSIRLFSGAS